MEEKRSALRLDSSTLEILDPSLVRRESVDLQMKGLHQAVKHSLRAATARGCAVATSSGKFFPTSLRLRDGASLGLMTVVNAHGGGVTHIRGLVTSGEASQLFRTSVGLPWKYPERFEFDRQILDETNPHLLAHPERFSGARNGLSPSNLATALRREARVLQQGDSVPPSYWHFDSQGFCFLAPVSLQGEPARAAAVLQLRSDHAYHWVTVSTDSGTSLWAVR